MKNAPASLKILLIITLLFSLFSPLLNPILSLSKSGIEHLYLWQLITYPFTLNTAPGHLLFAFLYLAANLFFLGACGISLIPRIKTIPFFFLYFSAALVGGLCALPAIFLSYTPVSLSGATPPLYALFVAWSMLNLKANFYFIFPFPFRAYKIFLTFFALKFISDLVDARFTYLLSNTGVFIYGYLFSVIVFRTRSPFPFLHNFENQLLRLKLRKK